MSIPAPGNPSPPPTSFVLETAVPLSQSIIWRLQAEMYAQRGLKAWTEDSIPSYITNNPFIADLYASLVFAFYCDCVSQRTADSSPLSTTHPLRILELGAGTGKFAYLFIRRLRALFNANGLDADSIRYCLSDCSEPLLESWRANRLMAELVNLGALQFELSGPAPAIPSSFLHAPRSTPSPSKQSSSQGPVVVIANYFFDSVPQDAFQVRDGKILEVLVTTNLMKQDSVEQDSSGRPRLDSLQLSYTYAGIAPDRYSNSACMEILNGYRRDLGNATVLFPTAALDMLGNLRAAAQGPMLVLAADQGLAHQEDLRGSQGAPSLEFHGSTCFSQWVNFDAIAKYFQLSGGTALIPEKHSTNLSICGFLSDSRSEGFPLVTKAHKEALDSFGADDLFALFGWLNADLDKIAVPQILALLRLSHWDPLVLNRVFPALTSQLRTSLVSRADLRDAALKTWANYFPLTATDYALAFQCGAVLLVLGYFEDSLRLLQASQQELGPSAATSYNLALSAQGLGRASDALHFAKEALALDAAFEPARALCLKLSAIG